MMRPLTHRAVSLTFVLCTASFLFAQTPAVPRKSTRGSISGKVTIKGKPAPGVVVGVRVSQPLSQFEATFKGTTDQEGKYRITDVPPGSYQISPVAPAYVASSSANWDQTVVLAEGENVDGIDFALVRGGVITGKVTDADGRPVVEQTVSLLSAELQPNQQRLTYPLRNAATDDRGIYRMFGLTAGRYKVSVGRAQDGFFTGVGSGRPSYKQTFHPDTTDLAKANIVEVSEGSEATNVDIAVGQPNQGFAATGRVVNGENNQPIANVRFGLQLIMGAQNTSFMSITASSNSQGEYRLENLAPGKYAIFIVPQKDSDIRADPTVFEITDQDLSDLLIKTSAGATVAGTIVLENTEDKAALSKLLQLSVQGFVQGQTPVSHSATINADGSFLLRGFDPGILYISLAAPGDRNLLKGFTITRFERDGAVQPRGMEIKNGDQITGVKLMVSYGTASIHGLVKVENGPLPPNVQIYIQVIRQGQSIIGIRPPPVDARGHFIVEGIPGGTYAFNVTMSGAPGIPPLTTQQQVIVTDGVVNDVTITLDLNQKPGPPSQ